MKKFLSLVLALVMTMSLVTISAGATDFTDDASIKYEEAVKVMDLLGVINGYEDGSFKPANTLTRGAAAKIITNFKLGPDTAAVLKGSETTFPDVPSTNVFSGYIAYCASEGIIAGYADGTFRPAGTLTANAFMKMLIGALGYDTSAYVGDNFATKVALKVKELKLAAGTTFVGSKALTREEACLFAFNALFAHPAEVTGGSTVTINGITVVTGGKEEVKEDVKYHETVTDFADLKVDANANTDEFGRPVKTWKLGKKSAVVAATPVLTYKGEVTGKALYTDLGLGKKETAKVNELTVSKDSTAANVLKDTDINTATYIYETATEGEYQAVIVTYTLGKVADIVKADADKEINRAVKIKVNSVEKTFETENFAKGDEVFYAVNAKDDIIDVVAVETVEGTVTRKVGDTVTVAGKNYTALSELTTLGVKSKGVFTLSYDGSTIVAMNATKGVSSDLYAYVYAVDAKTVSGGYVDGVYVANKTTYTVYFVKADGTLASAPVAEDIATDKVYNYAINAKGEFEVIGDAVGTTSVKLDTKLNLYGAKYPSSSTKYVFIDAEMTDGKVTKLSTSVVTGYKNAKSDATSAYVITDGNGDVVTVFVLSALKGAEVQGLTAIVTGDEIIEELSSDGTEIVYSFKAFNGKEIYLPVASKSASIPAVGSYVEYKLDSDGYFELVETKKAAVTDKVNAVIDENLVVANAANIYTLTSATTVYVKAADGSYSVGALADVVVEANVTVYANDKNEATLVIVNK